MAFPLEVNGEQMQEMGHAAVDFIANFVDGLDAGPADGRSADSYPRKELLRIQDESASDFGTLLKLFKAAAGLAVETAGPRFAAYIPGGGLFASALAEFLARSVNRFTGHPDMAPELVAMEHGVLQWLCREFRMPDTAGGLITTGGSMATLSAVVAARSQRLGENFADGTIYTTDYTHHCVRKAARIAGFPAARVRYVPTTKDLRMDPQKAHELIAQDRSAGLRPFFLVASAGTTDTGTVDPIDDLAQLAAREGLWFHVDAAYGGFFQLTQRGRALLSGIELADSIVLDPHKGMFLPYGTGILLVRNTDLLQAAHADDGNYMQDRQRDQGLPDFSELGPELTRDFRGLRMWLPLRLHGAGAFREALDEKLDLAAHAYGVLVEDDRLELPWKPDLSTVAFRLNGGDYDANCRLLERINATNRLFLSSTTIDGRFTLRLCILSHRTHRRHVDEMLDIIQSAARKE
ncbi:MAG: pyridoxal phosphate-dependent decarboxylase family protein [Streptosporangiaceae bacterium]